MAKKLMSLGPDSALPIWVRPRAEFFPKKMGIVSSTGLKNHIQIKIEPSMGMDLFTEKIKNLYLY